MNCIDCSTSTKTDMGADWNIVNPFLRAPKPVVICNGIPVSSIWQLVSIDHEINLTDRALRKLVCRLKL